MEETDRLIACEFCKVKSYLATKDFFRYMFASQAAQSKDLVFFPYWRFKGMLFACAVSSTRHKFIDVSHQAVASRWFPISIGLRSQALKLQFVTPKTAGRFLKPTQSFDHIKQTFENRFDRSLPRPVLHHAHIGETLSLIYAPFYVENQVYDAVLNRPISAALTEDFDIQQLPGESPSWRIHFISTLCPNCGWDLEGERQAMVLLCKNCTSAWYPKGRKLKKIKFGKHPTHADRAVYLPFWRIRTEISGIHLNTYADLIRIANIPKVVQNSWEDIGFHFWTPAFKVRPKIFLQLSNNMTLAQLHNELITDLPEQRHYPVTLPVTEAIESLTVSLASFIKPQNKLHDILAHIEISAKNFMLVWVPFQEKHHEFVQPDLQYAINKNILALSENL